MISQITGTLQNIYENTLTVNVTGISYEIYIPTAVLKGLDGRLVKDSQISIVTYHYYQTDPSKSIPVLIGFSNKMEKEFFEKFITVSGVGPKAAVRALSQPISDIAQAIDAADLSFLKSLPGIGEQRAKEIIAKLQGKMGKFGLIQKSPADARMGARPASPQSSDLKDEALEILLQLQYKKDEARRMVEKAFSRKADIKDIEELLNEVYRQRKSDDREQKAEKSVRA